MRRLAAFLALALGLHAGDALAQCNAPPLPRAGETVRWTRAGSPYRACGTLTIPAGGSVEVEPGVTLNVAFDAQVVVAGSLTAQGTAAAPVTFAGTAVYPPMLLVGGTLDVSHAVVTGGQIRPDTGSTLLFADVAFHSNGMVYAPDSPYRWVPPFLRFERCRFDGVQSSLSVHHATLVVRDCDFTGTNLWTSYSYPWLDDLRVTGAPQHGIAVTHDDQPLWLNRLAVRDSGAAGIQVGGAQAGNDFALGPDNVLEGNAWPVVVGDGGLVRGSFVPAAGNDMNVVNIAPGTYPRGPMTLPRVAVPYYSLTGVHLGTGLTIDPGVEIRLDDSASLIVEGGNFRARGTEDDPIRLVPHVPGVRWGAVGAQAGDTKLEHVLVVGSRNGVTAAGALVHVESCVLQDNGWGVQSSGYNPIRVRGSRFLRNDVGAITDLLPNSPGFLDLDGQTNPNTFLGNGIAVQGGDGTEDATHSWWGTPSGPRAPTNPSGTGDRIGGEVLYQPFRTTAPDASDAPPRVVVSPPSWLFEPGTRQVLRWTAEDDGSIASQRVVLAKAGEYDFDVVLADGLAPGVRELAFTVPEIGYQVTCLPAYIRVVATDDAGQEGWDQAEVSIRSDDWRPTVEVTTRMAPAYRPGDVIEVCFRTEATPAQPGLPEGYLFLDGDRWAIPLGGPATSTGCLPLGLIVPMVSTDSARIGIVVREGCNRFAWGFSECFAIRPDPRVPDAAPVIALTAPADGTAYSSGETVALRWTASDDEALRSFDVLASYDGGRTWHEIVKDLPPDSAGYDWRLPAGEELPDLRVRVMVRDLRFQDSSTGCGLRLSVVGDCTADADGDGVPACADCDPSSAAAWALPGPTGLLLATGPTTFGWTPPADAGATTVLHDVLRSRVPSDFTAPATCLASATAATTVADPETPGRPSGLFCYLVRARNACSEAGAGSLGTSSFGVPRPGRPCP